MRGPQRRSAGTSPDGGENLACPLSSWPVVFPPGQARWKTAYRDRSGQRAGVRQVQKPTGLLFPSGHGCWADRRGSRGAPAQDGAELVRKVFGDVGPFEEEQSEAGIGHAGEAIF